MLLETLRFTVENSNTMEELKESSELLIEKKRWLRRLKITPDKTLSNLMFKGNDKKGVDRLKEAIERLNSAPPEQQDKFESLAKDLRSVDDMLREVDEMQQIVTKKMKDIIWGLE